jgi:hypothetical protein
VALLLLYSSDKGIEHLMCMYGRNFSITENENKHTFTAKLNVIKFGMSFQNLRYTPDGHYNYAFRKVTKVSIYISMYRLKYQYPAHCKYDRSDLSM